MGGEKGVLYVVATPIGNLEDVTLRALRVLKEVAVIACEDTRTTRKLLIRHGIETPVTSCHEHNEERRSEQLIGRLTAGEDVALVSDAGTPLISDPGRTLVAAAHAAEIRVVPVPGPSAALAALMVAGLATDRFSFFGFPPARGPERRAVLSAALSAPGAVVLFEAPHRLARTLDELAAADPERPISLHRELTKVYEESRRGTLGELAAEVRQRPPRGEYTLVLGPARAEPGSATSMEEAVKEALALIENGVSRRDAARQVAGERGVSRRLLYAQLVTPGLASQA